MTGDRVGSGCGGVEASHRLPMIRGVTEVADGQVLGLGLEGGRAIAFFLGHLTPHDEDILWTRCSSDAPCSAGG